MTLSRRQPTIDTKKVHTGWNSTERNKEKRKFKIKNSKTHKKLKTKVISGSQEKHKNSIKAKPKKSLKTLEMTQKDLKKMFAKATRNQDSWDKLTLEELSTISIRNANKHEFNDDEFSIKFTDSNINGRSISNKKNELLILSNNNSVPKQLMPSIQNGSISTAKKETDSQELQTQKLKLLVSGKHHRHRKSDMDVDHFTQKQNLDIDNDVDLLTYNEYISNAKMAKEQKYKLNVAWVKNKLTNFMRPMTSQQTPSSKNKLEAQAEFKIKNLLKWKKKHNKIKAEIEHEHHLTLKRKHFNYKTPPPELAHVVPLSKRY